MAMSPTALANMHRWRWDPVSFVKENFGVTPDKWQAKILRAFPYKNRIAMKACKGPGKSCLEAWLIWNFLATRDHPKIACTSITGDNLSDGLWTELSKWQQKSEFLSKTFKWTRTRIENREHPETWWASARTWAKGSNPEAQADTLAGLHADFLLFVIDEAGGVPDAVMAAAEAGLSTGIETKILIGGNPTKLEGPLYRACTTEAHLWMVVEITGDPLDPNRSPRISTSWANEQIEKYGRDNPWVMVNVFGQFPPSSINSLIGPDEIRAAMHRVLQPGQYNFAPKILGVDVAREGNDATVIFPRQGLAAFKPMELRKQDSTFVAGAIATAIRKWGADGVCIDNTGGYGSGVVDRLNDLGYADMTFPVNFSETPFNRNYANKRAEIWFEGCQWIKRGAALPDVPQLSRELVAQTYSYRGDRMIMAEKKLIKALIGVSTDFSDALFCTFAYPIEKRPLDLQKLAEYADMGADDPLNRHRVLENDRVDYDPIFG